MQPTEWITIIGNFGFPIAITVYLLLRFEKKIDSLTCAIEGFEEAIHSFMGEKRNG